MKILIMRSNSLFIFLVVLLTTISNRLYGQQNFNFSFDKPIGSPWFNIGDTTAFKSRINQNTYYSAKGALQIESIKKNKGFGGIMMWLPSNLKGDSIEVSAMIKRENITEGSYAAMMLRIDPKVFFDNMANRQIRGTKNWENIKLKTKLVPDQTEGISIAFFLSGEGKMWVDDVLITVDGKDITREMGIFVPFAKGISDPVSSGISDFNNTPEIDQRLVDLGRIWGFLKYKHPAVAQGKYDWDQQLFKSMNTVIMAKDNKSIESHYAALLDSLGTTANYAKPHVENVVHEVDYSWIDGLPFNDGLKDKLRRIRYSSFDQHHYFDFAKGAGNVLFKNEKKYENVYSADAGFRLLTLFRFWNMIEYFSPYKNLTDPKWDTVLKISVPEMILSRDDRSYGLSLLKMVSRVKDAHTGLWSIPKGLVGFYGKYRMPVEIRMIEGKAVVTKVFDSEKSGDKLRIGDVLITKEHKKVEEIRDSLWAYMSTPNETVANRDLARKLVTSNSEIVRCELVRDGQQIKVDIAAIPSGQIKPASRDTVPFKMMDNNILYINHSLLRGKMITENMANWSKVKGVVIDDRNYPGDFLVFKLTPLLLTKPTDFVRFTSTSLQYPGTFVMSSPLQVGENANDCYQGKVAILVNEDTQSSAEYHVMAYQAAANVKVFGSQTAGADGNVSYIDLPGNQRTMLSGLGVYYPDQRETQRVGIKIDQIAKPSIKGVQEGRDEVLEKALDYLNK